MFVIIAYDIPDTKRRTKVMKLLEGYGAHVQESVFECDLEPAKYQELRKRLHRLLKLEQDNLRCYHLCQADVPRIEVLGVGYAVQRLLPFKVI
ncbi:MAG: CRISPR-associated endonuclease Cas2 [Anaerolineae bacterium]|nr:CRISPR-associated endonuclease Cas2 [Anaerolineae bacterium]